MPSNHCLIRVLQKINCPRQNQTLPGLSVPLFTSSQGRYQNILSNQAFWPLIMRTLLSRAEINSDVTNFWETRANENDKSLDFCPYISTLLKSNYQTFLTFWEQTGLGLGLDKDFLYVFMNLIFTSMALPPTRYTLYPSLSIVESWIHPICLLGIKWEEGT